MLRLAVSLVVTLVFLAMPIAEASHAEPVSADICETGHSDDFTNPADEAETPGHDHSDHHAHKCGSCHVHLVMKIQSFAKAVVLAKLNRQIGTDQALTLGMPDSLYRPPRSFS